MNNWKDDRHTFIGSGVVFPIVLLLMMLGQLATGRVYIPPRGRRPWSVMLFRPWTPLTQADPAYWLIVAVELGLALFFAGWFGLANTTRFERYAPATKAIGLGITTFGTVGLIVNWVASTVS